MIRDLFKFALRTYSKTSSSEQQMVYCMKMINKPTVNPERFERIWQQYAYALVNAYEMSG